MTTSAGSGLILDSQQDTLEGHMPYQSQVVPPASGLIQWSYSLVVEGADHAVPFTVTLRDAQGREIASDQAVDGVASIEGELREQTYDLQIDCEQEIAFRGIRSQTFGYHQ